MNPHIDESGEIGVFDAAQYFSGYEMHASSNQASLVEVQSNLKALNLAKVESNLVLQKPNQKKINNPKEPSSPVVRLAALFNSLFHKSTSMKNKLKPLESQVHDTAKSYPLNPKVNKSLKHHFECNDGFAGEIWRDRRLEGVRVVGKRWVLNNSANEQGLSRKVLFSKKCLDKNEEKIKEDDDRLSDASSDLFELENCK